MKLRGNRLTGSLQKKNKIKEGLLDQRTHIHGYDLNDYEYSSNIQKSTVKTICKELAKKNKTYELNRNLRVFSANEKGTFTIRLMDPFHRSLEPDFEFKINSKGAVWFFAGKAKVGEELEVCKNSADTGLLINFLIKVEDIVFEDDEDDD